MSPLPRFQKLPEERKRRILDAAREEFVAYGFAAASYNRIIEAAGVSKGAMYYYFEDKADLYRAILDEAVAHATARIGALGPAEDAEGFWSAVSALFERAVAVLAEDPSYADVGRLLYAGGPGEQALEGWLAAARAFVADALARGQRVGAVREDLPLDLLTTAVLGLIVSVDRYFVERWEALSPAEMPKLMAATVDLLRRVAAPSSKPRRRTP